MCRDASFEPSTINIGVQAFDLWTCARKTGREGMEGKIDNVLKRVRSVIFHANAKKCSGNRMLLKFAHRLSIPTLLPVQNLVYEFLINGSPKMPVSNQNDGDHYSSLHYRAAVMYCICILIVKMLYLLLTRWLTALF